MIFFAIFIILSIFGLYQLSASSILNLILNVYFFVIIYSLWRKFQENDEEAAKPQTFPTTIEQEMSKAWIGNQVLNALVWILSEKNFNV